MALGPRQALQMQGPLVAVQFALADPDPETWKALGDPVPSPIRLTALIDTGATHTTVRRGATKRMRIPPTASLSVTGVDGLVADDALGYFGHLLFAKASGAPDPVALPCTVFEGLPRDSRVDCLLGRDVLMHGQFSYDGAAARCDLWIKGERVRLLQSEV